MEEEMGVKGGQGRTVLEIRHSGFTFGLCMALGVVLGAVTMWVGTQSKERVPPAAPPTIVNVAPAKIPEIVVPQAKVEVVHQETPAISVTPKFEVQMPVPEQPELRFPAEVPVRVTNWPEGKKDQVTVTNWPAWMEAVSLPNAKERDPNGTLLPPPRNR